MWDGQGLVLYAKRLERGAECCVQHFAPNVELP
jgi:hypothetical protein